MKSKTDIFLIIMIFMVIGQGCAGRASYQFLNQSARPAESRRFFAELDSAVYRSGNHNGAYFEVTGFPYLRANRFLVFLKDRLRNDTAKNQWVRLMQQLDIEARRMPHDFTAYHLVPYQQLEMLKNK